MREFDGQRKTGIDSTIEDMLVEHCEKFNISPLDAVQFFPVLVRRQWLKRFLAHVELFQKTLDVPGDIADLGVFRGSSLMTWANLLESYCIGDRTKTVYGYDNWTGFSNLNAKDGRVDEDVEKFAGGFSPGKFFDQLCDAIKIFDADRFIPWKARVKLVVGDIENTIPKFVEDNPGVRFSIIHFDCDMYQPTKVALECLWPLLSRGGIAIFDEYAIPTWPGETKAVDEFLADNPHLKVKTFSWTNAPAGYIIKE